MEKLVPNRHKVTDSQGITLYEWEQDLDDIKMYIMLQPNFPTQEIECIINPTTFSLRLKGDKIYLIKGTFQYRVKHSTSYWYVDDNCLEILINKMDKGSAWEHVIVEHPKISYKLFDETKRKLLLQRYQETHNGMDFTNAEVGGELYFDHPGQHISKLYGD